MIKIKKFSIEDASEWDTLVERSINGTFLHYRGFYLANNSIDGDHSLIITYKGNTIALLPGEIIGDVYISHPRATYGGYIFSDTINLSRSIKIVENTIEHLRKLNVKKIIITLPFREVQKQPSNDVFNYSLIHNGFTYMKPKVEIYINLNIEEVSIRNKYTNGTMSNIIKSQKELYFFRSDDIVSHLRIFWPILEHNLYHKHNTKPTHTIDQILNLVNIVGHRFFSFYGASYQKNLIAGALVFNINSSFRHLQYIAQDYTYQAHRPLSGLVDHMIIDSKKIGYSIINLGTPNEKNGGLNEGLLNFKESFGSSATLRESFECQI